MSRIPILVILGATGSGKTKLGIELARKFNGEIISADSMQVYKGLDIVTAKVTKEQQMQARHHMIDVVDPLINYNVLEFKNKALPIMDNLISRKMVPVIVGGTNYYIESLIWHLLIADEEKFEVIEDEIEDMDEEDEINGKKRSPKRIRMSKKLSNIELHNKLREIDPEMATRLHPNNTRRIIRSLQVFEQHGKTHSEILKEQRAAGGCGLGGPLRNENSIILWLTCSQDILDSRLDARVDKMIEDGLIQELLDFHDRYNKDRLEKNELPDYTKGIFQTIGFKEFHEYLILPKEKRESDEGKKLLDTGVKNMKIVTRRYARRQKRWIMNRFIRRADRQVPPVYSLNCADLEQWESEVYGKAIEIVSAFMTGKSPLVKPINQVINDAKDTDSSNMQSYYCETCERIFIGEIQWDSHMTGAKHKKTFQKKNRLQKEAEKLEVDQIIDKALSKKQKIKFN